MKTTKKLFSLLLALVLTAALCAPAFAAGNGSITIENASKGVTYEIYKVFDLTFDANAPTTKVAYSYTKTGNADALFSALDGESSPFTLTPTTTTNVYNVAIKKDKTADDISSFLNGLVTADTLTTTISEQKAEGDAVTFNGLDYGYYLVASTQGTVVSIDSTNPSATIYDKNSTKPGGGEDNGKTHENGTYDIGDTVPYTVTFNTTNWAGSGEDAKQVLSYTVKDDIAGGSLKIKKVTKFTIGGTDYTVEGKIPQFDENNTITIPWVTGDADNGYTSIYDNNTEIVIEYTALVTGDAAVDTDQKVKNTVTLTWTTTGDPGTKDFPDPTPFGIYGFTLKKEDSSYEALDGAEFALYYGENDTEPMTLVLVTDGEGNSYYRPATEDDTTTTTTIKATGGFATVKGLAENHTYYLEETKAPDGYNKLLTRQQVVITNGDLTQSGRVDKDGKAVMETKEGATDPTQVIDHYGVVVMNLTGAELPSTGGMGTTILTVVGLSIMIVAAVLLITKKRMEGKEEE